MKLSKIYKEDFQKRKRKPANYKQLWQDWIWGTDCIAPVIELCGDMNTMHMLGLLLSFFESLESEAQDTIHSLLPSVPLVHLYRKPISQYSLRELTTQVPGFFPVRPHH